MANKEKSGEELTLNKINDLYMLKVIKGALKWGVQANIWIWVKLCEESGH